MLVPETRLTLAGAEVAAKVIDGEAIIMNLANGTYYSMDGAGAVLWEWIVGGHTIQELVDGLTAGYTVSPSDALADVHRLADKLVQDGLLRVSDAGGEPRGVPAAPAPTRLPYRSPDLVRYEDMAELLALD